ncbi:FAD-dependent oxidoreductase [Ideonella sp. 4Y16]|uniref:FAD-dependent oxidoreductase n=1 Tax=Ideonella alba TaxID=2824118 RepID=A0A941BB59_9BURK|nr:FAD-dependent oxidoreductase [Ideonella alba]MBQ0930525.1 FAD-dependent oxidoreductase [Ideonella alba]MBQ0945223.1 FAD-dependent oxidoreductase [Ideonella alba]
MRIAIVGSGISGLAVAHALRGQAELTLFEAGSHFGGHAHTVDVTLPTAQGPVTHGVDTGFLVFNHRTYPRLLRLFDALDVPTAPSDMSFSVQAPTAQGPLEWSGHSLDTVFAQRSNLLRPRFWGMLSDLLRFNRLCTRLADSGEEAALQEPLQDFLDRHRFGTALREHYLLPMLACIWSCPTDQMLRFPVATMIRFCHNHGLLQVSDRPQWYTVRGGSREYVRRIVAGLADARLDTPVRAIQRLPGGVRVHTDQGSEAFDEVVLATHAPQALALLGEQADALERSVLGAIRTQPNRAVLHTDASVLPSRTAAWAAWNFESAGQGTREVCLHYLINRLQPLPWSQPVVVSLNPLRPIAPQHVLGEFDVAHPVFDQAAIDAQRRLPALQGQHHTWFCGAWAGYGFHEDGLAAGQRVAEALALRIAEQPPRALEAA